MEAHAENDAQGQIEDLLARLVIRAKALSSVRCPYANRQDDCTARFSCPYRAPLDAHGLPKCGGFRTC